MRKKDMRIWFSFMLSAVILAVPMAVCAQQIPKGQTAGELSETQMREKKQEEITKKITSVQKEGVISEKGIMPGEEAAMRGGSDYKVRIDRIVVEGVTALTPQEVSAITAPYEGKELALADFRDITDKITSEYKKRGNVTAVAYLIPQKIQNNTLRIGVAEGRIGNVDVSGNEFFKSSLITKYLDMKKGDIFNYDVLRQRINFINENPDRNASVVLSKGAGTNETDVNVRVDDSLPWHATIGYSNYLSKYLDKNKFFGEIKSTNFLGLDHLAAVEFQVNDDADYKLASARYVVPLTPSDKIGAYYIHLEQQLGREVSALEIEGYGDILNVYWNHKLIDTENFTLSVSPAFEYKNIENKILDVVTSEDNMRIFKLGMDADFSDRFYGRNIITQEFDFGIPDIFNGLDAKDAKASRVNTGNEFFKSVTNAARIQAMPLDMALMLRGSMQLTSNNLTSTEQITIGGPTTVRGYPVAEHAGDRGYNFIAEYYIPPYGLPEDWEVPMTDTSFYDALRFVLFFDWGLVVTRNPQVGEVNRECLYSIGPAVRFDIPGKLAVSFDYGFGLGQKAGDGSRSRGYIEAKLFF